MALEVIKQLTHMDILAGLNEAQKRAVTYEGGPLLILAGAGSGKTRVLTHRASWLIENGVDPSEICLLTFTNKAAGEMLKRIRVGVVGGTFHSFSAKMLRRFADEAGLDPNFVIFDEGDQLDTVKQAMIAVGADPKAVKPGSVLGAISGAKNELISPGEYAGFARGNFSQMVSRVYLAYQQLLKKYKALDFDDLLGEMVKLLKTNSGVRDKLQEKFKYILVDEYQDTNKAQYEITKDLTKKYKNLTVVGDAAQSVYSWRGADYRNMLALKSDFPDLTIMNLEQNYRSTQTILDAANKVISKNKNHPVLNLWTDRNSGEKVTLFEAESELEEANYVMSNIQCSVSNNYSDYAVLYRTNAQSRVLEEALLHAGIPYSLVGGVRFYERKEVKDMLAYLRLVLNPDDEIARKRAEKNGKTRLVRLEESRIKIQDSITLDILDEIIKITQYLEQFDEMNEEDAARLENIKELRSVAQEYPNLPEFLENIALTEKASRKSKSADAVTLMTLHAAKGLEFKTVFMVGMEEGLFPHSRSLFDAEQMEEERRLAYVGMTRAMDKLYLTYARRRLFFGTRSNNAVSRFLADIPEVLIEQNGNPTSLKLRRAKWGFDAEGNWKWTPD
ncbi:MAG: DNA helicase II / ATP-dependent DNA helicase PcrA [Microgenomates group bacterium Gr01-1014_16]|nr:MAG: DNA helicase II / ATP-dependent DNA helicase PcrA [Microgenomates group bacterium Gr01-1014_16]